MRAPVGHTGYSPRERHLETRLEVQSGIGPARSCTFWLRPTGEALLAMYSVPTGEAEEGTDRNKNTALLAEMDASFLPARRTQVFLKFGYSARSLSEREAAAGQRALSRRWGGV